MTDWKVIAEGDTKSLKPTVGNIDLPPGTPVRIEIDTPPGLAYVANLGGMEQIVSGKVPNQLRLIDAHAEGGSLIVLECEAVGAPVLAIVAIVVAVGIALGIVVLAIRVKAPDEIVDKLIQEARNVAIAIGVIAVAGLIVVSYIKG